jgi:hypothetical protein
MKCDKIGREHLLAVYENLHGEGADREEMGVMK